MSIRAREWAWHESKTVGTELLLLLAIAEHMQDDPRVGAWPSQERLAAMIGCKATKTVGRVGAKLAERGLLAIAEDAAPIRGEGRRGHLYRFPALVNAAELADTQVSGNSPELGDTQVSGNSGRRPGELPDIAVSELPDTAVSQLPDIWVSPEQRESKEQGEGRERPPSTEVFDDHCAEHRHTRVPPKCWQCAGTRRQNAERRQRAGSTSGARCVVRGHEHNPAAGCTACASEAKAAQ